MTTLNVELHVHVCKTDFW